MTVSSFRVGRNRGIRGSPLARAVVLVALCACDPAYFEYFPVDDSAATVPIEQVLREFEKEHLGPEYVRVDEPNALWSNYRERGYEVLRWYDRDRTVGSPAGSSNSHLALLVDLESRRLELVAKAFPSFGEPDDLERVRTRLSEDLCAHGFVVEGACGD